MINILSAYPFYDGITGTIPVAHGADDPIKLQQAYGHGYIYVETNVVATSDDVPIALHGSEWWGVRSDAPSRRSIEEITYEEARERYGVFSHEELITSFPGFRFFLDIKTARAVSPIAKLINKLSLHDRVSIGGSNYDYTHAVQERVRDGGFVCSSIGTVGSFALLGTRLGSSLAEDYIRRSEATHFTLPFQLVRSDTAERAHKRDMGVLLWTPNRERQITKALSKNADGIMSDNLELLKSSLDQAGR